MDVRCRCIRNLSHPSQIRRSVLLALQTGRKETVRRPERLNLHNGLSWRSDLTPQAARSLTTMLTKTKSPPPPNVNNGKYLIPRSVPRHFLINIPTAKYGIPTHKKLRTQMNGISIFHKTKLYFPKHRSVIKRIGAAQYRHFSQPRLSRKRTINN